MLQRSRAARARSHVCTKPNARVQKRASAYWLVGRHGFLCWVRAVCTRCVVHVVCQLGARCTRALSAPVFTGSLGGAAFFALAQLYAYAAFVVVEKL